MKSFMNWSSTVPGTKAIELASTVNKDEQHKRETYRTNGQKDKPQQNANQWSVKKILEFFSHDMASIFYIKIESTNTDLL